MQVERKDKEINGSTYSILLAPPSQCMALVNQLHSVSGSADKDALMVKTIRISKLSCNDLPVFESTAFDRHFDSHRGDLFPAFEWALEEQVSPFLSESVRLAYRRIREQKEKMESQSLTDG